MSGVETKLSWHLVAYAQYRVLADWTTGTKYQKRRADRLALAIEEFATQWLAEVIDNKEAEIDRLRLERNRADAEARRLRAALKKILTANDRFRAQLPPDWEGNPVNDACIRAREVHAKEGK